MPIRIEVDREKCGNAMECKLCLRICPQMVFMMFPSTYEKYKLSEKFYVRPVHAIACVLCNLCVEKCPKGAIKIIAE